MISVVLPTYNARDTIGGQLEALSRQSYEGEWEVIIADNGSTDDTLSVAGCWKGRLTGLRVVDASARPGAAAARNIGARAAHGDFLAFCDADDVVGPQWLEALAKALREHDFVAGSIDHDALNPDGRTTWVFRSHESSTPLGQWFKPYALSATMAVARRAFEEIGGFPEDLGVPAAGEDMALSWLLQLAGYDLHFEPRALVAYRHRHTLGGLWRQHVDYGLSQPALYRRFRESGMPRRGLLTVGKSYLMMLVWLPKLLDPGGRGEWMRHLAIRWGRVLGSIRERVLYL